jgi:hypothetical protein
MGWDAYATWDAKGIDRASGTPALTAFRAAAAGVVRLAGAVDCQLEDGRLDCHLCRVYAERATGQPATSSGPPCSCGSGRRSERSSRGRGGPPGPPGGFLEVWAAHGLGATFC